MFMCASKLTIGTPLDKDAAVSSFVIIVYSCWHSNMFILIHHYMVRIELGLCQLV